MKADGGKRGAPGRIGRGPGEPWGFLAPYLKLVRRSSLVLVLVLGRNPSARFHVRELARSLGYDPALVSRNLRELGELGLLTRERVGNLVLCQADMDSVLLRQVKVCLTLLELRDLARDLGPAVTSAVLYGSCARGEDTEESDIDLFIETVDKERVMEILGRHRRLVRNLSPIMGTPDEVYRLKSENPALFGNIERGISLAGGARVP